MNRTDNKPMRGWAPALALLFVILLAGCGRSASDTDVAGVTVSRTESTTAPAVVAPTTAATAAPTTQATYVIQSGDTLSVIAERFGIKTAALAEFNAITDVNSIKVGQEIRIPPADFSASPTTTAAPAQTTASS